MATKDGSEKKIASQKGVKKVKKKAVKKAAKPSKPLSDAHELARLRTGFYRDNYRRLISLLLFMIILLTILCYYVLYLYTHRPAPTYFATNLNGEIIPLQGMDKPVLSTAEVLDWSRRAVSAAFTYNYVEYQGQIETAKDTYFTDKGGNDYLNAVVASGNLDTVKALNYIVTSQVTATPEITNKGVLTSGTYGGRYGWQINVPVKMTSQNPSSSRVTYMDLTLLVVRNSIVVDDKATSIDAIKGIGIGQFGAKITRGIIPSSVAAS